MIIVTNPAKPFTYTVKNTPRRKPNVDAYAAEIEALYDAVEETAQSDIRPPVDWTEVDTPTR